MQRCKNLSKKLNGTLQCKITKSNISYQTCNKNCLNFILIKNKGIKKVGNKRIFVSKETYQKVYNRDKGKCRLCGTTKELQLHHINGRGKNLTNNVDNCIMLCNTCHNERVHKNQKKYRPILLEKVRNNE